MSKPLYLIKYGSFPVEFGERPDVPFFVTEIAGTSYYDYASWREGDLLIPDYTEKLELVREPENEHDGNAIAVFMRHKRKRCKLGYIKRALAAELAPMLDRGDVIGCYSVGQYRDSYWSEFVALCGDCLGGDEADRQLTLSIRHAEQDLSARDRRVADAANLKASRQRDALRDARCEKFWSRVEVLAELIAREDHEAWQSALPLPDVPTPPARFKSIKDIPCGPDGQPLYRSKKDWSKAGYRLKDAKAPSRSEVPSGGYGISYYQGLYGVGEVEPKPKPTVLQLRRKLLNDIENQFYHSYPRP